MFEVKLHFRSPVVNSCLFMQHNLWDYIDKYKTISYTGNLQCNKPIWSQDFVQV